MKKTTISVSYDEEKLSALKLYLEGKDITIESALEKALNSLYTRHVPVKVRSFFDMRSGIPVELSPPKQRRRRIETGDDQPQTDSTHDDDKEVQT